MKRKELTEEYIRDYWLKKAFNIDSAWLVENEPELIKTPDWYDKYPVSQELHDEWRKWAIDIITKTLRLPKKYVTRSFTWTYWNTAPNVKKPAKD